MLSKVLKKIEESSNFQVAIFGGLLHIRGRILSPSEIEQASLANTLILQSFGDSRTIQRIQKISKELSSDEPNDDVINEAVAMLQKISPQQLAKVTENQDKILIQCIKQASQDGTDWENIKLVQNEEQQDAEKNLLWVGILSKEDRGVLLDKIMAGHMEAVERLNMFRR